MSYFTNKTDGLKNKEQQFNLSLNLGYHYNWVIAKKINFAPYIFMGIGEKWSSFQEELSNGAKSDPEKNKYVTGKLGTGIHLG